MSTLLLPAAHRPLTDQQQSILAARDHSVSVSAGAGCGKTFVLTERFLAHVDPTQVEPGALDELVAITFTDAAAREMRDRIRRRCFERLQSAATAQEAAAWQRLMRSMDGARISTIHAFCTKLLRTYAVEAGLDPQFEVLDAAAAELLKLETVDDRLRALLLAGEEDVLDLAAKRGLDRLRNDVAALAGPGSAEAIARWRTASPADVVARWRQFYDTEVAPAALDELRQSPALVELRSLCDPTVAKSPRVVARLSAIIGLLDRLASADAADGAALVAALHAEARVGNMRAKGDWHNLDAYASLQRACVLVRGILEKCALFKPPDFDAAHESAAQGLALLRLVADVSDALDAAKARRRQLEFDDLLARAGRLLSDPAFAVLRDQARHGTRLLMVDEFQDTNPLQVSIIQAFCGDAWRERGLFAVGDFKQSIYRFTGAEPQVSTNLRNELPPRGRLPLTRNFRSQPAITDFVNAIFHDEFDDYEPLSPARPQSTPTPAVEFLWTPADDDDDSDGESDEPPPRKAPRKAGAAHKARLLEAERIARRLVELITSQEQIVVGADGQPRPLQLGDIAVLLRSLSDAQVYEQAFRDYGLEYYLAGGHAFYSQQEVYDVLNLLRAVASPVDEIALAGALRSPLFALQDETLFWLVEARGSLNAGLVADRLPETLSEEEAGKVRRAAATITRLRIEKDRRLVADLFALAMELTGYDAVLLTEFLGSRKSANIEKLNEQARVLDRSSPGDLQGFITQLSEFVVRAPKEALAATQAEGDVIRIMTIHHAKGLEFPLVVAPDLDRKPHPGSWEPVLDVDLGPLMPVDKREKQVYSGHKLYRQREMLHELEERTRLLYVTCTRAADYLILSSSIADPTEPKQAWLKLIDRHVRLIDGSLAAPLPPGFAAPQVRVLTEAPSVDPAAIPESQTHSLPRLIEETRALAARSPGELPRQCDPIGVDGRARRRFSFSQLTGHIEPGPEPATDPFAEEATTEAPPSLIGHREGDALALGGLVHAVLERVDLRRPAGVRNLCEFLAPQFCGGAPESLAADAAAMIERFLDSPRAAELAAATLVRREVEFLLPWPPEGAYDNRYMHGYIDCLYQDAQGRWRLLDYKTNRTPAGGVGELARKYELQMLVYALACERALGVPLAECVLQSLDSGGEKAFTWDAAARRSGADRITAAMQSLMVVD